MSTATKSCPLCGEEILAVAEKCRYCREWVDPERRSRDLRDGSLLGNTPGKAIIAGYLGLLALFPVIGCPLGVAGVLFGIAALAEIRKDASLRGRGRAWVGIVLGALGAVFWGWFLLVVIPDIERAMHL